ncbi:drought-responsive family protein [Tripterygium wilfordii]|uniref:Drought-responsive family protein n=1 Tax=Tripterygium wilfordii TaxID=458696 RepID=A0A7J7CST9_TRIWF|nr:protein DEHYDRATION-INDUCED 19 homolog 4-like [Tripterygium wilfordii]KAF5737029.1 drought-responsive family protein [Tripterygium wilfordii]
MASDSWISRLSATSSRRYQSRSDLFYEGHDEIQGDEDSRPEFLCPFCAEDFDIVGLCCHIDEDHPVEAKNGVCPVCAKRVGMDLVGHITVQHGSYFKVQRKRRLRKGGSNSTFSMLRKELREGNLQSLLGGSSYIISSSNTEPDPLLSSFIFNPPVDEPVIVEPLSSYEASSVQETSEEEFLDRKVQALPLSDKDQEERARKSEFVQGLLLSTMLDDIL